MAKCITLILCVFLLCVPFYVSAKLTPKDHGKDDEDNFFGGKPKVIGAVCANHTLPHTEKGVVLNTTICDDNFKCPAEFICKFADDGDLLYSVCCNQKFEETYAELKDCPGDSNPYTENITITDSVTGKALTFPTVIHAKDCKSIKCPTNHTCVESKAGARCCSREFEIKTKKHCAIGDPVKGAKGGDQTCGKFFRKDPDPVDCPEKNDCTERESRAYCCQSAPPLFFFRILTDLFNENCSSQLDDFSKCSDRSFGVNSSVLDQINITDYLSFADFGGDSDDTGSKGLGGSKKESMKNLTLSLIANFSSQYNETELKEFQNLTCSKLPEFNKCVSGLKATDKDSECYGVQLGRRMVQLILGMLCDEGTFKELIEATNCIEKAFDKFDSESLKCGEAFGNEIEEDITFGIGYLFHDICKGTGDLFMCMDPQIRKACPSNGAKHAPFMREFITSILSIVFGDISCSSKAQLLLL